VDGFERRKSVAAAGDRITLDRFSVRSSYSNHLKNIYYIHVKIQSIPRSKHTPSRLYKPVNVV
jgi:hypothetical protein